MKTSKKILIVTGDAGESFEILFASHRLREAGWKSEHNCIEVLQLPGKNHYSVLDAVVEKDSLLQSAVFRLIDIGER